MWNNNIFNIIFKFNINLFKNSIKLIIYYLKYINILNLCVNILI